MKRDQLTRTAAALMLAAATWSPPITAQVSGPRDTTALRVLTPDDVLRVEDIDRSAPGVFSPDGQSFAFVRERPRATVRSSSIGVLGGSERGDVWLAPTAGGPARNLTRGDTTGAGYWAPVWSPDGARLAMLSTAGGNVRLWVWERTTGRLSMVSSRGIDAWSTSHTPCVWTSATAILCPVVAEGVRSWYYDRYARTPRAAMRAWTRFWTARQASVGVVESGSESLLDAAYPLTAQGALAHFDVVTRTTRVVISGPSVSLTSSPDRRHVAVLRRLHQRQPDGRPKLEGVDLAEGFQLIALDAEGAVLDSVAAIEDVLASWGGVPQVHWSPDGTQLAIVGRAAGASDTDRGLFTYDLRTRAVHPVALDSLWSSAEDVGEVTWGASRHLVVRASHIRSPSRADWWLLETDGAVRNLTAALPVPPDRLITAPDGRGFLGIGGGAVWRIDTTVRRLTDSSHQVTALLSPSARVSNGVPVPYAIVKAIVNGSPGVYRLDGRTGDLTALRSVAAEARLTGADLKTGAAAFVTVSSRGTTLSIVPSNVNSARPVAELNTFLRTIAEGTLRQVDYAALDGQRLTGWVLLPPGYQPGRRYPMVVWVYIGQILNDAPRHLTRLNDSSFLNLQLLAARGYVVLLPSMPRTKDGPRTADLYHQLPNGVLPAVSHVVALGIADSTRVAVMGQSGGGYSTMGLITQTSRFRAAVSIAGISNLTSNYGTFESATRYADSIPPLRHTEDGIFITESFFELGAPPWEDPQRYLRNSPLFYAGNVTTPLLLMHGDMDANCSMFQSEEFFTALYRQGKRARFVRYWGEGHSLESPANIRDMWRRVYAWLDEWLAPLPADQP